MRKKIYIKKRIIENLQNSLNKKKQKKLEKKYEKKRQKSVIKKGSRRQVKEANSLTILSHDVFYILATGHPPLGQHPFSLFPLFFLHKPQF